MERKFKYQLAFLMLFSSLATVALADDWDDDDVSNHETVSVRYLWLLNGIRNTYECEIPPTDMGTTIAGCHDHEIIDLKSNQILGVATDATADVSQVGDALIATGTTTFHLPQGMLMIRGRGAIQPMPAEAGTPELDRSPMTHIAGIFPNHADENNVIGGTGLFKNARGTFGLLGALDLTNSGENQAKFHCVYFIDLELSKKAVSQYKKNKKRHQSIQHLLNAY